MKKPVFPKKIQQLDNFTLQITWNDDISSNYRLSDLQKKCPCAQCVDEKTGQRLTNETTVKEDVRAKKIFSVGRYALRIEYTSGCSTGIYDYDSLYRWTSVK